MIMKKMRDFTWIDQLKKKIMAHPIHQANENSPYGDLTRGQFYEKHQIDPSFRYIN